MEITVNLYGEVRGYLAKGKKPSFGLRIPSGTAVTDVLDYLKVPSGLPVAVVVNGTHRDRTYQMGDADVLSLFPMSAFADEG